MRILIVDDEMVSRAKLQVIMQSIGECETADSGPEAMTAIEEAHQANRPFDLICLDVSMPQMDGYEVCKRLKADKRTQDIPVIFVTAEEETEHETKGFELGAADYIKKPFNPAVVKARVRTHLDLKRHRDCLEEMVTDRTAQLKQANKRLAVLDQEKLTFLRYLSHEMNTPLNWIGVTNIIDQTEMGAENRELLGMVEKGFERLSHLVKAVLSYFEIAGRDLNLQIKSVSVKDVVSDIIDQHASIIASKDLQTAVELGDDFAVMADPGYFKKLMTVLVENAIAFSDHGGTVTITSEIDRQKAELIIVDNGKGIKTQNLENVFKPFATEDCERRAGGYGLNLPKAKLIADAHGWKIRAQSTGKGHGAAFIIESPKNP